jgi:predicted nucleic acid-binding protein
MTRYLLDTNVLSETRKVNADANVIAFIAALDSGSMFVSVLTLGELRKGVAKKLGEDPDFGAELDAWVNAIENTFSDRVLDVDTRVARLWGELSAHGRRPVVDTLLAATAVVHTMTLVTRNVRDMLGCGATLINPWDGSRWT